MIDLRSDTVTVPTEEMRKVMAAAPVGDDVYGEDPSVNELQEFVADLLGKEAALYVCSGTQSNQIAIAAQTNPGDEVIIEDNAHIFYYETSAPSLISRVQLRTLPSNKGIMDEATIKKSIRTSEYYFPKTSMLCLENTHNRHSGAIIPLDYIKQIEKVSRENNLIYHCDGARIWNACAATGISPKDYSEPFDSISVCLSKGLGAPIGSVLVGTKEMIKKALKWRKILGGGMRQAGIIASAGLFALKNHFPLLKETHRIAKQFADLLLETGLIKIDATSVQTNIVMFEFPENIKPEEFLSRCKNLNLMLAATGNSVRAVFHFQVSDKDAVYAAGVINKVINELNK